MNLNEAVEQSVPRHVEPEDWLRFRQSIAEILTAVGMEVDGPATARTPSDSSKRSTTRLRATTVTTSC